MALSENIKKIRKSKGFNQIELAQKTGLSKNAIWNYENGKRMPPLDLLRRIAQVLEVNVMDLLEDSSTNTLNEESDKVCEVQAKTFFSVLLEDLYELEVYDDDTNGELTVDLINKKNRDEIITLSFDELDELRKNIVNDVKFKLSSIANIQKKLNKEGADNGNI